MADVIYKKGQSSNLDNVQIKEGQILVTEDTGEMYVDVTNSDRKKINEINLRNGSKTGSLRTVGSTEESSEYTIGTNAFAEGKGTQASGYASHAEGWQTTASGDYSHAEGWSTTASGNQSHAEGNNTTASGSVSHAEGANTKASGENSHAEGTITTASGLASHAEGSITTASGRYSHAEGKDTTASSNYQHVQGKFNIEDKNNTYADIIGNGSLDSDRSNAYTLDWSGNAWYAGDVYVGSTSGTNKDEGSKKLATEDVVNTKMDKTNPTGTGSFSLNRKADTTVGDYSFAEGNNTTASSFNSHAEGNNTTASGSNSHAEGGNTTASGYASHAEGNYTTASGHYSHAEGANTKASSYASHAEGNYTTASGSNSHAEGGNTTASGYASHAEGNYTTASSDHQHVQGKYNIADSNSIYVDIIGNGSSDTKRSNAATVDWEGNAWYAGDVYVGSDSGTNKDEGSKKLATEEYIDNAINKKIEVSETAPTEEENKIWLQPMITNVGAVDYIVEQGISGIWTYRKWNSGRTDKLISRQFFNSNNPDVLGYAQSLMANGFDGVVTIQIGMGATAPIEFCLGQIICNGSDRCEVILYGQGAIYTNHSVGSGWLGWYKFSGTAV